MKTVRLFLMSMLIATVFTSCYTEVIVEDPIVVDPVPVVTMRDVLLSNELWYNDIHRSNATGEIPFMQMAFTFSFRNGVLFANNNLVGIGSQGYGFGIDVGTFDIFGDELEILHDIDGGYRFIVTPLNNREIELYHPPTNLRYVLVGYQRSTFDYDLLFYENIHYFLQEYSAWEKTYTSAFGDPNPFDYENYLQFLPGGGDGNFQSSEDVPGIPWSNVYWDYTGIYNVDDVPQTPYLKYLTLDYDFMGNEYFELNVINDRNIELLHSFSGTVYRFTGRGFIELRNTEQGKLRLSNAQIEKQMKKISNF